VVLTRSLLSVFFDLRFAIFSPPAICVPKSDEAVHSILNVMYADAPYTVISRSVPIHPTVSELLPTVFQSLVPLE
jgi:hypothetical protein